MLRLASSRLPGVALATLLLACNGNGTGDGTETATGGETTTASTTSTSASTTNGSMSGTQTTTTSGASDSATMSTTSPGTDTDTTGVSVSTSESSTTTNPTDATTDATDATSTGTTEGTTTDTTTTEGTTTDTTTDGCVPAPEICNDIDDNCNGFIDDVDEAMDGICDCLNILILGKKSPNPSSEFEAWLEAQGTKVDRIHTTPNEVLDANTLAGYDIVLLDVLTKNYTPTEAAVLETFVTGGGGLIALNGFTTNQVSADVTNSLINAIGLTYNTSKGWFSGPITMFANHPITMGLTSLSFFGGLYVNIGDDGVGVNQTIMTLPQGPVGVVQQRMAGRAFVYGDEWVEFDALWQNMPEIKEFWVQTLKWVGPQNYCVLPQ